MHNFIVIWTINALLTVRSEMLPFSGNNHNIKIFGVPPNTLIYIGYVHNDNLPLGNIALQYVIPNNYRKVWWYFLMISCTFWRSRKNNCRIHPNYLVALITYEGSISMLQWISWSGTYEQFQNKSWQLMNSVKIHDGWSHKHDWYMLLCCHGNTFKSQNCLGN